MSGIYLHIPYCKQACYYCDFHFSTNLKTKNDLIDAIHKEIAIQRNYLGSDQISTIYFGGGTPSLLTADALASIIKCIHDNFKIEANPEITLEANPDDLNEAKLKELKRIGINRLSVGIQSFDNKLLKFFNRAHDAEMAKNCIAAAKDIGFENISVDLIFAAPNQTIAALESDLDQMIALAVPHVSIYGLTIEKDTVFGKWFEQNKLHPLDDDNAARQLELIMKMLEASGYEQYEISNFCQPGFRSRHNSSYWHGQKYLGIGPGAHSFNGHSRQFNVANNVRYINFLTNDEPSYSVEKLTRNEQINEYILTQIRLQEGIDCNELKSKFSYDLKKERIALIKELESRNMIESDKNYLRLTSNGKLLADFITEKLII